MILPTDEIRIKQLYPKFGNLVRIFLEECRSAKLVGGIFMGYRSYDEQNKLYAQGRTIPGKIITNAKGGQSYHNFGLAIDYVFIDKRGWTWTGDYNKVGQIAKDCGLEWGGSWTAFPDVPHIQKSYGEGTNPKKLDLIYRENIPTQAPLHAVFNYLDTKN